MLPSVVIINSLADPQTSLTPGTDFDHYSLLLLGIAYASGHSTCRNLHYFAAK